ncbi:MAG: VOC family protein [Anaerolineae bacterium]|nr:VOC family protein [Anaerolineae bacterium]
MAVEIVWLEIPVKDIERAAKFYEAIFGVKSEIGDDGTRRTATLTDTQASGVGISLNQTANFEPSNKGPLAYLMSVNDDMDASLAKVEPAGGKVIEAKTSMGQAGWYGLFEDTEGNVLAFYSTK